MNAHLTSHHELHWHWMYEFAQKLEKAFQSPRVWQIVALVAVIAAIVLLLAFAQVFSGGSADQTIPYYGYPSYPGYPIVP